MGEADSTFFTLSNDGSAVAQHTLGIFYDHRTRPILVTDHDDALNQQQNTAYYYDREDRLIGRVIVPLVGAPNDFTMEWYVQIDPLLTGTGLKGSIIGLARMPSSPGFTSVFG